MHKLQSRSLQSYKFNVKYYLVSQILLEGPKRDPSCPLKQLLQQTLGLDKLPPEDRPNRHQPYSSYMQQTFYLLKELKGLLSMFYTLAGIMIVDAGYGGGVWFQGVISSIVWYHINLFNVRLPMSVNCQIIEMLVCNQRSVRLVIIEECCY